MPFDKSNDPMDQVQGVNSPMKIDLDSIPPGSKPGDVISLKVKSIDKGSNCAYLSPADVGEPKDMDVANGSSPEGVDADTDGTGEKTAGPVSGGVEGLGMQMALGPMGKLKNYLAQKSVETQNQQ